MEQNKKEKHCADCMHYKRDYTHYPCNDCTICNFMRQNYYTEK